MRINKFLAQAGIASRRKVDILIEEGMVTVNGKKASLGQEVNQSDNVLINGQPITTLQPPTYIILNKPKGVTSTVYDPHARRTVIDILRHSGESSRTRRHQNLFRASEDHDFQPWVKPQIIPRSENQRTTGYARGNLSESSDSGQARMTGKKPETSRLFPVGRLDQESTGLILLTNDGELANRLTHPKFHIPKTYEVTILGEVSQNHIGKMESGIFLEESKTAPAKVEIAYKSAHKTILNVTIYEGRKRQIRRMTSSLHLHILSLKRISIGPILLGNLPSGKFRNLKVGELKALKNAAKLLN